MKEFLLGALLLVATSFARAQVNMQFVVVGDPENPGDTNSASDGTSGHGSVGNTYAIGKYEVTDLQYTAFLNAVDSTGANILGLWTMPMSTAAAGGITFNAGATGGAKYSLKLGYDNIPVVSVTWISAVRFANWLSNGQGSSDTETGAYTLLGGTASPSNSNTVTRNPAATVWLPSEDEWYKAAYYDPTIAGGNKYWLYPTRSNTPPDNPNGSGTDSNSANYYNNRYAVTGTSSYNSAQNYLTEAGAYSAAGSHFGTYDQGGDVSEWTDTMLNGSRNQRGGSFDSSQNLLRASSRFAVFGQESFSTGLGFRVATAPEPTTAILLFTGLGILSLSRHRR